MYGSASAKPDASTLSTLEPLATILLAALFLGERISNFQMLGGVIILCAVIVLARYGDSDNVVRPTLGKATL